MRYLIKLSFYIKSLFIYLINGLYFYQILQYLFSDIQSQNSIQTCKIKKNELIMIKNIVLFSVTPKSSLYIQVIMVERNELDQSSERTFLLFESQATSNLLLKRMN